MADEYTPGVKTEANTVSNAAETQLSINTTTSVHQNPEDSPRLAPFINVSEPTPIDGVFPHKAEIDSNDDHSICSCDSTQPNDNPPLLTSSAKSGRKSRSRASSITSNIINEIKESSTIQKVASKIKSRHSAEDSDGPLPDTTSSIAVSVPGVSGVYLASAKRNQDFHTLFRSVPEDDGLIEDYGCALQKEILLQGRIYISESYLCFNANIFGWVTNLVIAFSDIIEIEKKSTAYFIPNAIQISTDNAKHFFASFLSRDQAYDLMIDVWRTARPDLAPPKQKDENNSPSPEAESLAPSGEESGSFYDSDTEDSYSGETDSEDIDHPATQDDKKTIASATVVREIKSDPTRRRAVSETVKPHSFQPDDDEKTNTAAAAAPLEKDEGIAIKTTSESKPQVHEKTDCECNGDHFASVVMDHTYYGTLEKFSNLLFKSDFMSKFLVDNQKSTEFEMGEWKKGDVPTREYSYIKPLSGPIGPKSTKCYITQEIVHEDLEKSVTVLAVTSTPDVPSGGSFTCKTKTCLTYAGKGKVRVFVTVLVDFTKSSWLKTTIERASIDGQKTYYKDLDTEIHAYMKQHPEEFGKPSDSKKRKHKKRHHHHHHHRHTHTPEERHAKEEQPKSFIQQIVDRVSDNASSVISAISSPRATHFTLFCLIVMVGVNMFIARKMAVVEQQLIHLGKPILQSNEEEATTGAAQHHRKSDFIRQEEDDLWEWLGRVDPDKSNDVTERINLHAPQQKEEWDEAIKSTKLAKNRLDKHMKELTSMIQKAEESLGDITKVVHEQRHKIKSQP